MIRARLGDGRLVDEAVEYGVTFGGLGLLEEGSGLAALDGEVAAELTGRCDQFVHRLA